MSDNVDFASSEAADLAAVSAAIGRIYDTVFDRTLWPAALGDVCALTGGCASSLTSHSRPDQTPERAAEYGTDPVYSRSYLETYGRINPLFGMGINDMAEGEMRVLYRTIDAQVFQRTRFYREWVRPQGWGDWISVVLIRSPLRLSLIAVARKERRGGFTDGQVNAMRLMTPHIQRAARLAGLFDERAEREQGMAALLGRIDVAALLIDTSGRIVFANAAAEAMLASGDVLARERGGFLRLADAGARRMALDAVRGESVRPDIAVVDTAAGKRMVSVMPASPETGGLVAVLLSLPEAARTPPGLALRDAFRLTPAELRVLSLLLRGRSAAEIAGDLGVTPRTIRAHLHKLFEKTGASRQSDLIREALRLAPPFG